MTHYVTALAHELGQSASRLWRRLYQYGLPSGNLWQDLDTHYRHLSNYYRVMTDLERLYYAEGGFLVTVPKPTARMLTDCTTVVSGNLPPRQR